MDELYRDKRRTPQSGSVDKKKFMGSFSTAHEFLSEIRKADG
jgi:hypothetical protein